MSGRVPFIGSRDKERSKSERIEQMPRSSVSATPTIGNATMPRKLISSGSRFEAEISYSRAVVDGDWIFVSGTTGFDYSRMTIAETVVAQCEQAMLNIEAALTQAGASMKDVVRVRYFLPRREDFEQCWPTLKKYLGDVRPAATMVQAALIDPQVLIEIEVTARRSIDR